MTTTAKSGAARKGGAARRESAKKAPSVKFGDLELKLPVELPPEMLFDITEIEVAADNPLPIFRLLRSLLGPEQFTEVRSAIASGDAEIENIGELINDVFSQYGVSAGEASAS